MIRTLLNYSLGLFTFVIAFTQTCEDYAKFDYPSYPYQPFEFKHMNVSVTVEPELHLVRGVVTYSVYAKVDGIDEIAIQTSESAIDGVTINEKEVEFEIGDGKLNILLPDTTQEAEEMEVSITWQSNSAFGLYKDYEMNFWSSKNPLALQHWLPVFDYPGNELTFDARFIIPKNHELFFNGNLEGVEQIGENRKRVQWKSNKEVPVTGLGFALGNFLISEVTSGLTKIRLFSSETSLTEEERNELIRQASSLKKVIENTLSFEYPWEGLNIVVLPDNFWEEKTHGAGTIFLYRNLGPLSEQLQRGLYAQWFGEYQRTEQFLDFENPSIELLRTALHYSVSKEAAFIQNPDTLFKVDRWNTWQHSFLKEDPVFQQTARRSLSTIIQSMSGVIAFKEYADVWYEETGISWHFVSPEEIQSTSENISPLIYLLDVQYDEMNSELTLIFNQTSGNGEEIHDLVMTEFGFSDSISHEVNFTSKTDTLQFSLAPDVEYLSFESGSFSIDQIEFGEFPLFLLLNQLRSKRSFNRVLAARLLQKKNGNPDLQLALNDVLVLETNFEVKAALLETMAVLTDGATGTEEQFLSGLQDQSEQIQVASLRALANYSENEGVKNAIRDKILLTENDQFFMQALKTYKLLANGEELINLTQQIQRRDTIGTKTLTAMNSTVEFDSNGTYVSLADDFLEKNHSYPVRKSALSFLLTYDNGTENWMKRMDALLEDKDPRIRFLALDAITLVDVSEAFRVLSSIKEEEYDIRVVFKAEELLETLSD